MEENNEVFNESEVEKEAIIDEPDFNKPPKKKKTNKDKLYKIVVAVLLVVSLACNGYLLFKGNNSNGSNSSSNSTSNAKVEEVKYDVKSDTTSVIDAVENSVIGIQVYSSQTSGMFGSTGSNTASGSGSGVIYEADGKTAYILTNHHVIDGASRVEVVFSNGEYVEAEIIGSDSYSDVAVLKCNPGFDFTPINVGDSSLLDTGESVLAIGSPLGIQYAGTVTQGIVSATDRTVGVDLNGDNTEDWDMNVVQTDAAINPGNSGGALVNMQGELVGITSMKFSNESIEGMGFALPINDVMNKANDIRENGKVSYPALGISAVSLDNYSSWELQRYGVEVDVDKGIYITRVNAGGVANEAGIEVGDVIVKFDGEEITTYKQFLKVLYSKSVGDSVEVTVNRNGTEHNMTVALEDAAS